MTFPIKQSGVVSKGTYSICSNTSFALFFSSGNDTLICIPPCALRHKEETTKLHIRKTRNIIRQKYKDYHYRKYKYNHNQIRPKHRTMPLRTLRQQEKISKATTRPPVANHIATNNLFHLLLPIAFSPP